MYAYDPVAHAAIAEPVLMHVRHGLLHPLQNQAERRPLPAEWTTVDSHLKVTVPVTARPKLTTWDGDGDCIGSIATGGTCPTTPAAFLKWLKDESSTGLVAVTTTKGQVTKMAAEYTD